MDGRNEGWTHSLNILILRKRFWYCLIFFCPFNPMSCFGVRSEPALENRRGDRKKGKLTTKTVQISQQHKKLDYLFFLLSFPQSQARRHTQKKAKAELIVNVFTEALAPSDSESRETTLLSFLQHLLLLPQRRRHLRIDINKKKANERCEKWF